MLRRWGWLAALAPLGAASLLYVVIARGFLAGAADPALAWPLLGILPLFAFSMWLLTASTARSALFLAWAATAMAAGSAYETFMLTNPDVIREPWYPIFNLLGLAASTVASAAFVSMFATFPTGIPERRWQRISVWLFWVPVVAVPFTLLVVPHVLTVEVHAGQGADIPNPFALPALAWAGPIVTWIAYSWPAVFLALAVLVSRTFFGDPEVRVRTRPMAWVTFAIVVSYSLTLFLPEDIMLSAAVLVILTAVPLVAIHGILRYGAFDVAAEDRARFVTRSADVLTTVLYGIAVVAPAVLLAGSLTPLGIAFLTALVAVALLPVRGWLQRWFHRLVFGDRDRQLAMLSELGAELERSADPGELLTQLAAAVADGLGASWVRIRLAATDGALAASPAGVAGDVVGEPVEAADLVHADEVLGRIEVGKRHREEYSDAERALLRTVAGQAAASVANVRLTARLAEQLAELTASRERLVAAQDDERRRLERDLHDGIQQDIVAQIAGLRLARNRLERGQLGTAELSELQQQARQTLTDLRELAHGIHPPVLSDNGLVAAIESGAARFPIPLTVHADARVRTERYPDDVETTAYYVVREALANTAKHAHASQATVALARTDGRLHVSIRDDGCGLGAVSPVSNASGGLANIRDRVAVLRGTVRISGAGLSGAGTTVDVDLPVRGSAAADRGAPQSP
ncbi:histidine kinase/DNA gyrase B/HSP90-like ATPase [Agromyces ramosus]|uniref:histidine kinase n=1 Tax=Agromyces ramosus TaxID=33879 RepID=A0A4Q7MLM3_9MICO|nr:GAF domain-containing sensor histidine kinase [Agromyces ramosus]RZS68368.1 histidine kinase/DNA gyrase B/HSP90-like ATPase [Agromyces ramosus]